MCKFFIITVFTVATCIHYLYY